MHTTTYNNQKKTGKTKVTCRKHTLPTTSMWRRNLESGVWRSEEQAACGVGGKVWKTCGIGKTKVEFSADEGGS